MANSGHSVYDDSGHVVSTFHPAPTEQEWARSYIELKARHDELVAALREAADALLTASTVMNNDKVLADIATVYATARVALAKVAP